MSDPNTQGEPTMEEILASIRKIISEDEKEAQASAGDDQTSAGDDQTSGMDVQAPVEAEPDTKEDVLELTERVEDELTAPADPPAKEDAEIDAILASMTGPEEKGSTDMSTAGDKSGGIASPGTESAVTTALSDFAGALMEQNKEQQGPVGGNQTLDALVRAALEPYLKSWLDEHLETLVERVVKEEIKRMVRRAEDI